MSNIQRKQVQQTVEQIELDPATLSSMQQVLAAQELFKNEAKATDRPFECTICGNRFRQQCHLTQHIRIHTNDRPYHCSHCEKAFKQKSQLNQHERIHTGEKPYHCELCGKAFPQAGQLYSHKKTHGINPRVTKDSPDSAPKRGRKRKSKAPVLVSPPPVAYLIENIHHPLPHFSQVGKQANKHIDNQIINNMKMENASLSSSAIGRPRIIPVSRDQYQLFLQTQMLQQDQQTSTHKLKSTSRSLKKSDDKQSKKEVDNSLDIPTSSSNVELEGVPAHLKDLEKLIPTCDQT